MNRNLAPLILSATAFATLGASSLQAQHMETAGIPFAFHVQSQTMPAGTYQVKQPILAEKSIFTLSDGRGHSRFVGAPLQRAADPQKPQLTFVCNRGACSLAKISLPGSDVSHSLSRHDSNVHLGMVTQIAIRIRQ